MKLIEGNGFLNILISRADLSAFAFPGIFRCVLWQNFLESLIKGDGFFYVRSGLDGLNVIKITAAFARFSNLCKCVLKIE